MSKLEKIKCPQCGQTLIFINHIDGEIKCTRCKNKIRIQKEKSEATRTHRVSEVVTRYLSLLYRFFNKEGVRHGN